MIIEGNVPFRLKGGLTHSIPKKRKFINVPGNARGISITPVIGKILDSVNQTHQETGIENTHLLQFGFTKGRNCTAAALLVTESIAESKDNKRPLYISALDVQKAFDIISHPSLLRKMFNLGLTGVW